jgi:hypothetical protein
MRAPETNRKIARAALDAFGGTPTVRRYWDANNESSVGVMWSGGDGFTSDATLNLSDTPLQYGGVEMPVRTEFLGALAGDTDFSLVLSTAAVCVINSRWFCASGKVFPNVVKAMGLSDTMHHVCFTTPPCGTAGRRRCTWKTASSPGCWCFRSLTRV